MACKFSCFLSFSDAQKENDVGIFQVDNGDRYTVKYKSNICRDLILKIEWTITKQILVTVNLYNTTFKRCFCSKGMIINGRKAIMKLRGAFNVSNSHNYKVLCVINMIPYIKFNECKEERSFDSGFAEPECQQFLEDRSNDTVYEKTNCAEENSKKYKTVTKDMDVKVLEIDNQNEQLRYSALVTEKSHQFPSDEYDLVLEKIALNDDRKLKVPNMISSGNKTEENKSGMSMLLMNMDNLSSSDKSDKTIKNISVNEIHESEGFFNSGKSTENRRENSENTFTENSEDILQKKSDMQIGGLVTNDTLTKINTFVETKSQDAVVNENMLTIDDFSKDVIGTVNIDVAKNIKSSDLMQNNFMMEVDFYELQSENPALTSDKPGLTFSGLHEGNLSGSNDLKTDKDFLSNNMDSNFHETAENLALDNKDRKRSDDTRKTMISTVHMEDKIIPEADDISMGNNQSLGKDLSSLPNNISTFTQDPDEVKANIDVQSSIVNCKSPLMNIEMTPAIETEINDAVMDGHNSISQKLPSSKTNLVFQTLVRKLSFENCGIELTDINMEVASNSELSGKQISEYEPDNANFFPVMESELKGLSMDMLDLLTSGDMADAIITNGEKDIKVHRSIVSARSSVLKEIFIKYWQDDVKYRALVDIPSYILEDVIIFLYVGLVYIKSVKMTQDLYKVAEMYRINDLIDICSKHISK